MSEAAESFPTHTHRLIDSMKAPYRLMTEGEVIFPSCYVGNTSTGTWELTTAAFWHSEAVPTAFQLFCAPSSPEDYKIVYGDQVISEDAVYWHQGHWIPVPVCWYGLGVSKYWHSDPGSIKQTVKGNSAVYSMYRQSAMVAHPVRSTWRTLSAPPGHRHLQIGEVVRQKDLRTSAVDNNKWADVNAPVIGTTITGVTIESARFIRPIPVHWVNWYVNTRPGFGANANAGTSLSTALGNIIAVRKKMQEIQHNTGQPCYGIIWDTFGTALQVFDKPVNTQDMSPTIATIGDSAVPESIRWNMEYSVYLGEPITHNGLLSLAEKDMPARHRILSAGEVSQDGDLIFTLAPGKRLPFIWQPVAPKLWYQPGLRQYIFCRHSDAVCNMDAPEVRLTFLTERVASLEQGQQDLRGQIHSLLQRLAILTPKAS